MLTGSAGRIRAGWRDTSIRAGLTRALLLPLTSLAALFVAHIEITALGASAFGVLTLLLAVTLLLPFADLGVGAAVTNAVAASEGSRERERLIAASLRLLALVSVVVVALGAVLSATSLWNGITGVTGHEVPSLDRDMLLVMVLFGLGLPLGLGGRILLGLDRYPLFLLVQGSIPFVTLAIVYWFQGSRVMTPFLLAPFIAQDLASLVALAAGLYHLRLRTPRLWALVRASGAHAHREIRRTALPMMLITIGLPVALQTDRLVLSHVATRSDLSRYAIVSMLYVPAWSIISSAGMSLWPRFAGMRSHSEPERALEYRRVFRIFLLFGGAGGLALVALGPIVTKQWAGSSGGSLTLWCTFGFLLLVQATHLPGAMFLTQPAGLRFQAYCVTAMCAVNVPLSVGLAKAWGAAGPVMASAVTILGFQLLTARRRILRPSPGEGVTSSQRPTLRKRTRQSKNEEA